MTKHKNEKGFTLVELLVALVVTSILLTAVSTLAFALSSASKATGDISRSQAEVRFVTLKLQDLIRNCNLICFAGDNDIALWQSDNNSDGKINISELVYIEWGAGKDHLTLCTFSSEDNSEIPISSIRSVSTNWWSPYSNDIEYVRLLPECSNIDIKLDEFPPYSGFVNLSFDLRSDDSVRQYQINAALRSRKNNYLDGSGNIVSDDD